VKVSSNFGLSSPERILVRCLLLRVGSNMSRTCECCVPPRSFVGISRASCTVTDIRPTSPDERELATTAQYVSPTLAADISGSMISEWRRVRAIISNGSHPVLTKTSVLYRPMVCLFLPFDFLPLGVAPFLLLVHE